MHKCLLPIVKSRISVYFPVILVGILSQGKRKRPTPNLGLAEAGGLARNEQADDETEQAKNGRENLDDQDLDKSVG